VPIAIEASGNAGCGGYISVFPCIQNGPQVLSWPFIGMIKVELLNHLTDTNQHSKVLEYTKNNSISAGFGKNFERI